MPTGYTSKIADGITFDEFVMDCARGMGALIMMRDEPAGTEIPERFEPSDYNIKRQTDCELELKRLKKITPEKATQLASEDFKKEEESHAAIILKNNKLRLNYNTMLEHVLKWKSPTSEHDGFKKFMIEQISTSIEFDCNNDYYEDNKPKELSGNEWLEKNISTAIRDIEYHKIEHKKEVERTESRNKWLKELRDSLK